MRSWHKGFFFFIILITVSLFIFSGCASDDSDSDSDSGSNNAQLVSDEELDEAADEALTESGWSEDDMTEVTDDNARDVQSAAGEAGSAANEAITEVAGISIPSFSSKNVVSREIIQAYLASGNPQNLILANGPLLAETVTINDTANCEGGGTVSVDGSITGDASQTDTYNQSITVSGTADVEFDNCIEDGVTIYGSGVYRIGIDVSISGSSETFDLSGTAYPKTADYTFTYDHGFAAGLAVMDEDSSKYNVSFYNNYDESYTIEYDLYAISQGDSISDSVSGTGSIDYSAGVNEYSCTYSASGDYPDYYSSGTMTCE